MNEVNQTLYIPLYGKAAVSKRKIILHDPKAEEIWDKECFPLKGKAKSKWLSIYMGMRAAVFDRWLSGKMEHHPDALVLHIGCGLDGRINRVENRNHMWFDIDFPEVITERKKYFEDIPGYTMLGADVRESEWLDLLPSGGEAIVVMEGVSMYMDKQDLTNLLSRLRNRFEGLYLLMDCYTTFAAKISKFKNPVNEVGVFRLCGIDDPKELHLSGVHAIAHYELTPYYLIDELTGAEKAIFQAIFAGSFARKLYQLHEYASIRCSGREV